MRKLSQWGSQTCSRGSLVTEFTCHSSGGLHLGQLQTCVFWRIKQIKTSGAVTAVSISYQCVSPLVGSLPLPASHRSSTRGLNFPGAHIPNFSNWHTKSGSWAFPHLRIHIPPDNFVTLGATASRQIGVMNVFRGHHIQVFWGLPVGPHRSFPVSTVEKPLSHLPRILQFRGRGGGASSPFLSGTISLEAVNLPRVAINILRLLEVLVHR